MRVGFTLCQRVKLRVMSQLIGDYTEEYNKLQWYIDEIKESNPGCTYFVMIDLVSNPGKILFDRFYVCFHACQ